MSDWAKENWDPADPVVAFLDQYETTCMGWSGGPERNPNQINIDRRAGPLYHKLKALVEAQRRDAARTVDRVWCEAVLLTESPNLIHKITKFVVDRRGT